MFWADTVAEEISRRFEDKIKSKTPLIIRDEKTLSGRVHIGAMRGVAVHGVVSEILNERNIANKFIYEINDFDPMDDIPANLNQETYKEYLGKPLYSVPSPDGKAKNFPEFYAAEFIDVIKHSGFTPEFYRSSDAYKSGKYNEAIDIALKNGSRIKEIYREISGSVKADDWLPLNVVCENCGKMSTTRALEYDGKEVSYKCDPNAVTWTQGCGHQGRISPFDGNAKLPWKVEWAAKFVVFGVDVEGAGKDHSTKGGARDIASHIAKEVFKYEPPFDIPYEFLLVQGKKMSSSKGKGSSSREIADLLPTEIFRLFLIGKNPKKTLDFVPDGDTIPILYDWFDKSSDAFFAKDDSVEARLFVVSHSVESQKNIQKIFLPRFSQVAFLSQMPHMDILEEVAKLKGESLTELDKKELDSRVFYAKTWLSAYAPEDYKFELATDFIPEKAKSFTNTQKQTLIKILDYIQSKDNLDGQELHTAIHDIRKESGLEPAELFGAIYQSFLGKDSGPKVGWFLSVLDKEFVERRLKEVSS